MKTGVRYQIMPSLVLGFHGTDETTAEHVLSGKSELDLSTNDYDWLGHGIYFWEHSPSRAWEFALEKEKRREIAKPAVIGAVIAPGVCFNLLESSALAELKSAYDPTLTPPSNTPLGKPHGARHSATRPKSVCI